MGITHRPNIYWNFNQAPEPLKSSALESFRNARKRLADSAPDTIIIFANDHCDQFLPDCTPSFCVGISDQVKGPFPVERESGIPAYSSDSDESFARYILKEGIRSEIDMSRNDKFILDHAFVVPLSFLSPEKSIPIVPIFTNTLVPPLPSMRRFHDLGKVIARAVECYDKGRRIALVGSINLSTEVWGPRHGQRDEEFDMKALELMKQGSLEDILNTLDLKRVFASGNATSEFLNYLTLLGAAGGKKPTLVDCPVVPKWGTCPTVVWDM